jgi:hypothetical protein
LLFSGACITMVYWGAFSVTAVAQRSGSVSTISAYHLTLANSRPEYINIAGFCRWQRNGLPQSRKFKDAAASLNQVVFSPFASNRAFLARLLISRLDKGLSASSGTVSELIEAFLLRLSPPVSGCAGSLVFGAPFCFGAGPSGFAFSPPWTISTMPRQLVRLNLAKAVTFRDSSQTASFPRSCDKPQTQARLITSHGARRLKALLASLDTMMPRPRVARIKDVAFPMRFLRASSPLPVIPGP